MKGVYKRNSSGETSRKLLILKNLQALPLQRKIEIANDIITKSFEIGTPALLYSGGKDSTVLLDLLRKRDPNILIIHNNTTLGDRQTIEFIRNYTAGLNYIETIAENPIEMWNQKGYYPILSKRGFTKYKKMYPNLRVSPVQCCYQLKEKYANRVLLDKNIKVVLWGNRAGESNRRKLGFVDNGFLFKPQKYKWFQSYPLQHFTDADILQYLRQFVPQYPISEHYESGCLCCGTDITFPSNNLFKLFVKNHAEWKKYMECGFAQQILTAKGYKQLDDATIKNIIENQPKLLLNI